MDIAFASDNGETINQHFGWSKTFYLYRVGKEDAELIKTIDSSEEPEGEQEKLNYKIGTINEADIMYCTQIGPTASKMVQAAKIHPARVSEGETIEGAISKLQQMLNTDAPPWLLRIYHKAAMREG